MGRQSPADPNESREWDSPKEPPFAQQEEDPDESEAWERMKAQQQDSEELGS